MPPRRKKVEDEEDEVMSETESNDDDDSGEQGYSKVASCLRKVANMSSVKPTMLMDTKMFNEELLKYVMPTAAPKLMHLFEKIEELDAKDMRVHKKHFKHMIFTDIDSSNYGAKLIASAFVAKGFTPVFTKTLGLKADEVLFETKGDNFGLLLSKTFGAKSMSVKFKKAQMHKYNERPVNVHGDLMRFIILDQGFKEGIDLFDVKYIHLFEPLVSPADQKQAIGRGTRFCGQKGLTFHPRFGWPLYVFRYDVKFAEPVEGANTLFELFVKYSDIDMRKVVFAAEVEKTVVEASVDHQLTKEIHSFEIEAPPPILSPKHHKSAHGGASCGAPYGRVGAVPGGAALRGRKKKDDGAGAGEEKAVVVAKSPRGAVPPTKIMGHDAMQEYIAKHFKSFAYPHAKLENLCEEKARDDGAPSKLTFTPTQDFIRHYFRPESAYKGILLFHSVGSGKTCTAIAAATSSFEREGYTILWVTRHTLKADIWKNMYGQICNTVIQDNIDAGKLKLPKKISGPMRYLSDRWIEPISYKQFSNMLLKNNKYYSDIVQRNGEKDPLRKTLVVIDEAHKLYAPNVTGSEKPQTDILEKMIQNSYKVSGKDSVRVMLMTATPYTEDAMELMKLLNNLREKDYMPTDFDKFAGEYLNNEGYFTASGKNKFQNKIAGYVSYVNRSQDGRNFAHPIVENVFVDISRSEKLKATKHESKKVKSYTEAMKGIRGDVKKVNGDYKQILREKKAECKAQTKEDFAACKEAAMEEYREAAANAKSNKADGLTECKSLPTKQRVGCRAGVNDEYRAEMESIKAKKTRALDDCKEEKASCSFDPADHKELNKGMEQIKQAKERLEKEKAEREQIRDKLKQVRLDAKGAGEDMKLLRANTKPLRAAKVVVMGKMKPLNAQLKAAKTDAAKKKIKDKLLPLRAENKRLSNEIQDIRARINKLGAHKKVMKLQVGTVGLGDISQETAMVKRCLGGDVEYDEE